MTDDEIKKLVADSEAKTQAAIAGIAAKYVKTDTWFQAYRREHPLAFQNILIFGYGPLLATIGYFAGSFFK